MKSNNYMTMEFTSQHRNIHLAGSVVEAFAAQMNPTLEEQGDIRASVTEAVANCVKYAYPKELGPIIIRCSNLEKNILDVVIKDKGVGIDGVEQARRPMFTTDAARAGMGFTIMENFMDICEVISQPGKGTTVHMRKRIIGKK